MPQLYWDTIEKGEQVTPLTKPAITRVQIARFAGASQDWSPLHLDDDFAKSAGYGGVFAHGAIALSFATEAVGRWLENGRILAVTGRFRKLVWPGDILRMTGMVAERYEVNGEARIDVDVWAENQNHDSVMQGTVTCVMWRNDKDEKKSKSPLPPVAPQTIKERRTAKPIPKSEADAAKARQALADAERARSQPTSPPRAATKPAPAAPRPAAPPATSPVSAAQQAARPASPPAAGKGGAPTKAPPSAPAKAVAPAARPAKPTAVEKAPAKGAVGGAGGKAPAPKAAEVKQASKPAPKPAPSKAAPPKPAVKAPAKPAAKVEKKPDRKPEKKPEKPADKKKKK